MYLLRCNSDDEFIDNVKETHFIQSNQDLGEYILSSIENGRFDVYEVLNSIYTEENLNDGQVSLVIYILTMGDLLPGQMFMDHQTAMGHFFCLQVNKYCDEHHIEKRIPSSYLAFKIAHSVNFNYSDYINGEESLKEQLSQDNIVFRHKFRCLLNEVTLSIPIVRVKKGFLKRKTVGYMLDPDYKVFGSFQIGYNDTKYRLPKSFIIDLLINKINTNKSYIFTDEFDLYGSIPFDDPNNTICELLQINNFYSIGSFNIEDQNLDVRENELVYAEGKRAPMFNEGEENVPATWQKVTEYLYRMLTYNCHLYVSYKINNTIFIMEE